MTTQSQIEREEEEEEGKVRNRVELIERCLKGKIEVMSARDPIFQKFTWR